MQPELREVAHNFLIENLNKFPEKWQRTFKLMYSANNLAATIEEVVKKMPDTKLDWAMTQVRNSLEILERKKTE